MVSKDIKSLKCHFNFFLGRGKVQVVDPVIKNAGQTGVCVCVCVCVLWGGGGRVRVLIGSYEIHYLSQEVSGGVVVLNNNDMNLALNRPPI